MLEELFTKYGTDKGIWGYTPFYDMLMGPQRFHVRKVLEVGICGHRDIPNNVVGASLFCWKDFFPNATIYGIDYDPAFVFNDQERIITRHADAYDETKMKQVMAEFGDGFDMIVDDAVHDPIPQAQLHNFLMPYMLKGGRYFIEDYCPYKLPTDEFVRTLIGHSTEAVGRGKTGKPEQLIITQR